MSRSPARNVVADWEFWAGLLLFAVSVLALVGVLPKSLTAIVGMVLFVRVFYTYGRSAWAKFVARRRAVSYRSN